MRTSTLVRGAIRLVGALAAVTLSAASCEDTGPGSGPRLAWSVPLVTQGDNWTGRPAAAAGVVVIQDGPLLRALDAVTGAERWRRQLRQSTSVNATGIVIAGGRVFTAGGDSVYAVSLANGARLWAFLPATQAALCDPGADTSAVYVGTRAHQVYALAAQTGTVLWNVDVGPAWQFDGIVVGTAVAGDTVFATVVQYLNASGGLRAGHVIALNRTSGAVLWDYVTPGQSSDVAGAPGIYNGLVVVGDELGPAFFAVNRLSGQQTWRVSTAAGFPGVFSTPVSLNGRVFAGAQGGVYAADLLAGTLAWKREDILAARDVGVCGSALIVQNQAIQSIDPANGTSIGSPMLAGGSDFPTSRIAASGRYAVVVGNQSAYGIVC